MGDAKENENEDPGEKIPEEQGQSNPDVNVKPKSVHEQSEKHHDSPNPMPPEDDNRVPSYNGNLPLENHTRTTSHNENIQSECSAHQDSLPLVSADYEKGSVKLNAGSSKDHEKWSVESHTETLTDHEKGSVNPGTETLTDQEEASVKIATKTLINMKVEANEVPHSKTGIDSKEDSNGSANPPEAAELADAKIESPSEYLESITSDATDNTPMNKRYPKPPANHGSCSDIKSEKEKGGDMKIGLNRTDLTVPNNGSLNSKHSFLLDESHLSEDGESGTEEEQSTFMKELENFFRERSMEFKPPKFYGEGLNCLKLWRAVTRLGGYDKVTSCKLWRQVGESFKPPKTCTTVSWTFRGFYEKALLDYERHKARGGELKIPVASHSEPMNVDNPALVSGRARRDAAARAMQGWHSQRLLGNGEVSDPIIKDKNSISMQKREKQLKSLGLLKRKKPSYMEHAVKAARTKASKPQSDTAVVDIGPPADWVKINVQRTKDCFEVYALVPGLLREEVRVQSDPAGRLVISGEPEHPDNPWGVTPFKKSRRG